MYLSPYPVVEAFLVSFGFGIAAYFLGTVSRSGLAGGGITGAAVYWFGGWGSFAVLGSFFVLGSALTRMGYAAKEKRGIAQADRGRRGSRHALANCSVGVVLAVGYKLTGGHPLVGAALTASFAAGAADTAATEFGSAFGRRAFLPTSFRRVPPGTPGAVSMEGTLASALAAVAVSTVGLAVGLFEGAGLWAAASVGGFLGAFLESVLGSLPGVEQRLGNEGMNVFNTAIGALICLITARLAGLP